VAQGDPTLSNLKVTAAHYALSQALEGCLGAEVGANFHSWAVWGSKKAGVTIRQEDLGPSMRTAAWAGGVCGLVVGGVCAFLLLGVAVHPVLWAAPVLGLVCGALCGRGIAVYTRARAAALILEGNRSVLQDIGGQTALFVALFSQGPPGAKRLADFLEEIPPGPHHRAGRDLLRRAFGHYAQAAVRGHDLQLRRQHCYMANNLAILHEHIRLQSYIEGSLPFLIRRCVTQRMMQFDFGDRALSVAHDIPTLDGLAYAPGLQEIQLPELAAFLCADGGWDRSSPGSLANTAATDWTQIEQRMNYVVNLFRCFHLDPNVRKPPYGEAAFKCIRGGQRPEGKL
jgi:hypothetical protein